MIVNYIRMYLLILRMLFMFFLQKLFTLKAVDAFRFFLTPEELPILTTDNIIAVITWPWESYRCLYFMATFVTTEHLQYILDAPWS